jgi:hypothetical protein
MATALAAIAAIGTIIGGIVYLVKTGVWAFSKTTAEKEQNIDKDVSDEKKSVDSGERPKWD